VSFPQLTRDAYERGLLERAARWPELASCAEVTVEAVRDVAAREGIDFATALLYDRVRRSPEHGPFIERLEALAGPPAGPPRTPAAVVIVPGAFYREYPHTGADGWRVRAEAEPLGFATDLVPTLSFGPLKTNARILCDWLRRDRRENLVLVSLSKGGADVKTALAEPDAPEAFRNVAFWVNLSGLLSGTPLVGWVFASRLRTLWFRLLLGWRGYAFSVVRELARGPCTPLDGDLRLPAHLRAIHVAGFPLARHLSKALARRCYRRVQALGPNDGAGILLADVCRWPGLLYPVWGADHYLKPAGRDLRAIARKILRYVRDELDRAVLEEMEAACAPPLPALEGRERAPAGRGAGGVGGRQ
jgi:hypothetical protein